MKDDSIKKEILRLREILYRKSGVYLGSLEENASWLTIFDVFEIYGEHSPEASEMERSISRRFFEGTPFGDMMARIRKQSQRQSFSQPTELEPWRDFEK